jgi:peptidyl-prolyl cis-trans isomerase SurA
MMPRSAILGLLLFALPVLHAGEMLDRIIATVNGHVILQSDWQDEVRYECFVTGRTLQSVTPQDRKGALDRLIDQELLREQMGSAEFKSLSPEEIEKQIEAVKNDYARDHGAQPWSAALSAYHLTEADIKSHIRLELSQLRLVDAHFRPSIQVDAAAVEAYYKDHLTPQAAGSQPISLQQATPKIRELLIQEKMNQLLTSWLETLHSQAQIRMVVSDPSDAQGPGQ